MEVRPTTKYEHMRAMTARSAIRAAPGVAQRRSRGTRPTISLRCASIWHSRSLHARWRPYMFRKVYKAFNHPVGGRRPLVPAPRCKLQAPSSLFVIILSWHRLRHRGGHPPSPRPAPPLERPGRGAAGTSSMGTSSLSSGPRPSRWPRLAPAGWPAGPARRSASSGAGDPLHHRCVA